MSPEEPQEDLFNRLLNDLEKSPEEIPASIIAAVKIFDSLAWGALRARLRDSSPDIIPDIIKVMKSGIFHKGGLKGRPLPGNNTCKVYFFEDLAYFILKASVFINSGELLERLEKSYRRSSPFDKAIKQIEELKYIANIYRSKRSLKKLTDIIKDLEGIKVDLLSKPKIVFSAKIRDMPDRLDSLISLFKKQLPSDTPTYNITVAISELLKSFNIYIEQTTILRRIEREKLI